MDSTNNTITHNYIGRDKGKEDAQIKDWSKFVLGHKVAGIFCDIFY